MRSATAHSSLKLNGSDGKVSAHNVGDLGSIPGSGRSPGEGNGSPLQYSCLENPQGQRSLAGYDLWGHKELDTTEAAKQQQGVFKRGKWGPGAEGA